MFAFGSQAAPNRPVVIMTVEGLNPELPSVLLNSHTDVACVSEVRQQPLIGVSDKPPQHHDFKSYQV